MTFSDKFPKIYIALNAMLVISVVVAFWLVFHPPTEHVPEIPTHQTIAVKPVLAPNSKPTPAPATISQGGKHNKNMVIKGVHQSGGGDGSCTQNVVAGDNNTQNCAPTLPSISDKQLRAITTDLKSKYHLHGVVNIGYQANTPEAKTLAIALKDALEPTGVIVSTNWFGMSIDLSGKSSAGLSFGEMGTDGEEIANALDVVLKKEGVIKKSIPRSSDAQPNVGYLYIKVDKP